MTEQTTTHASSSAIDSASAGLTSPVSPVSATDSSQPTFVLAPDSFKESMTAKEACEAMERGIRRVFPAARILQVPMADGGEGTTDSLVDASGGQRLFRMVDGPLPGQQVEAYFGILGQGAAVGGADTGTNTGVDTTAAAAGLGARAASQKTAVIEMAQASGIGYVKPEERNPLITSTYGTGQLIEAAIDQGATRIILGIGGSATTDGGAGMAVALGARLLDAAGQPVTPVGGQLDKVASIDMSAFDRRVQDVQIVIASDVTNPLCGPTGSAAVFGPQKGATPQMVAQLDSNLAHFAQVIEHDLGKAVADLPGAGAAGGLGAGLLAFTNSVMRAGIDIVIDINRLDEKMAAADYVFTGEGGMDFQTKFGKAPYGVAQVAKRHGLPVFACVGYVGKDIDVLYDEGMTAIFGILDAAGPLAEALGRGPANLERTAENIARVLRSQRR